MVNADQVEESSTDEFPEYWEWGRLFASNPELIELLELLKDKQHLGLNTAHSTTTGEQKAPRSPSSAHDTCHNQSPQNNPTDKERRLVNIGISRGLRQRHDPTRNCYQTQTACADRTKTPQSNRRKRQATQLVLIRPRPSPGPPPPRIWPKPKTNCPTLRHRTHNPATRTQCTHHIWST